MTITRHRFFGFYSFKEFSDLCFVEERHTQNAEHIKRASIQAKVMFDNGDKAISCNGRVNLDSDGIFSNTPK